VFVLFVLCKNCMTTSESNGRFFYKTNRFEWIRITNRIANWNALVYSWLMCRRIATIGLSAAATTDLNPHTGSDPKPWLFSHYFCANRTPFTAGHKHRKWHLFVDTSTPSYLRLLIKDRQHDRNLRSTTTALCQPFTTTTFAKRAFRCSAPAVWNSLPQTVLRSDCCSF